ncbi:MAG: hypothetical protein ACKO85_19280 [Isosphaeraceae bacterium]
MKFKSLTSVILYFSFFIVFSSAASLLMADDDKKTAVPALNAVVCVGDNAGQKTDLAKARASLPTIYMFIQGDKWDRPIARLLRELDTKVKDQISDGRIIAIWLSNNEVDRYAEHLPRVQQSLKLTMTTYAAWPGDPFGPADWNINRDDHVTIVTTRNGKISGRHTFHSTNEGDAPKILADFAPAK